MFQNFVDEYDHEQGEVKRVLVGSPGIGKSVLFFLAALGRARSDERRIIMYFRKVVQELSVFVMRASATKGGVHVLFSRDLQTMHDRLSWVVDRFSTVPRVPVARKYQGCRVSF